MYLKDRVLSNLLSVLWCKDECRHSQSCFGLHITTPTSNPQNRQKLTVSYQLIKPIYESQKPNRQRSGFQPNLSVTQLVTGPF